MAMQETLQEIKRQFEKMAGREYIRQLKDEVDKLFEKNEWENRQIRLKVFWHEKGMDNMKEEIDAVKKENADLKSSCDSKNREWLKFSATRMTLNLRIAAGTSDCKLQALVYDILPSTTAVFNYAIGSRKLSANEQFFVDAQTVVSLLQLK